MLMLCPILPSTPRRHLQEALRDVQFHFDTARKQLNIVPNVAFRVQEDIRQARVTVTVVVRLTDSFENDAG